MTTIFPLKPMRKTSQAIAHCVLKKIVFNEDTLICVLSQTTVAFYQILPFSVRDNSVENVPLNFHSNKPNSLCIHMGSFHHRHNQHRLQMCPCLYSYILYSLFLWVQSNVPLSLFTVFMGAIKCALVFIYCFYGCNQILNNRLALFVCHESGS